MPQRNRARTKPARKSPGQLAALAVRLRLEHFGPQDYLVTIMDLARTLGVSRATVKRRFSTQVTFPQPVGQLPKQWRWLEVRAWMKEHYKARRVPDEPATIHWRYVID